MKDAFRSIGLDLNNLEFSDAHADYIRELCLTQKTVSQARYRLKCEDAYMMGKVFEQLYKSCSCYLTFFFHKFSTTPAMTIAIPNRLMMP